MGIVHHSNHAKYLERGRVEFLRHADLGYAEVMKQGIHFPVTELRVIYKKPIKFDELILVETKISQLTKIRLSFSYKIFLANDSQPDGLFAEEYSGAPLVIGESQHCSVNDAGRPVETPANIYKILSNLFEEKIS